MTRSTLTWFKSSYSGTEGDNCIEVASEPGTVHVRDSKNTHGPQLALPHTAWATFVGHTAQR